jgi:hypothetical protein
MATVKAHIWHDSRGKILAVGYIPPGALNHLRSVVPVARKNQLVLKADVSQESLASLHSTHRVDVKKKSLVAKPKNS